MKLTTPLLLAALMAGPGAIAQTPPPMPLAPAPLAPLPLSPDGAGPSAGQRSERLALAERYMQAAHLDSVVRRQIDTTFPTVVDTLLKMRPDLPPQLRGEFIASAREMVVDFLPKLRERTAEAMAAAYTKEELEALVAFYESPVGVSIAAKTVSLQQIATETLKSLGPQMAADMVRRVCAKAGCPPSMNVKIPNES